MKNEFDKDRLILAAMIIAIIAIMFMLSGCSTEKKAQRKTSWLLSRDLMASECARLYPNHDSIVTKDSVRLDTLYLESEAEILTDTIVSRGDAVFRIIEKKCPPVQVITKYIRKDSIHYRTNTGEVERLKGVILDKEKVIQAKDNIIIKQQEKIHELDRWKIWFIILASLNVLAFVIRFFVVKRQI